MRDFVLFCRNAFLVLLIVFIADYALGAIMDKNFVFIDQPKYRRIEAADEDVVVLGASRADNQYVSRIIEDSLKLRTYNYGVGAQNVYTNYAILDLLIEKARKKPRIVIWDFYYTDIVNSPGWNTEKLYRLYSAYNYSDTIQSVLSLQGRKRNTLLKYINTYKFNSILPMFLRNFIFKGSLENGGYSPLYVKNEGAIRNRVENRGDIDVVKIEYINKMITLCKLNNIKLYIFISPGFYRIENTNIKHIDWACEIERIAHNRKVPLYNFEQDDELLSHPHLFYNEIHLNDEGAKVYTRKVAHTLNEQLAHQK